MVWIIILILIAAVSAVILFSVKFVTLPNDEEFNEAEEGTGFIEKKSKFLAKLFPPVEDEWEDELWESEQEEKVEEEQPIEEPEPEEEKPLRQDTPMKRNASTPMLTDEELLVVVENEDKEDMDEYSTYTRSGLDIAIYNENGTYPIVQAEIPGGKKVIKIGRSKNSNNDILINHRMVSKEQYELSLEIGVEGKETFYLQALKEENPIRIADEKWQEVKILPLSEKYCLSHQKKNRFLINRMGVKMEIINHMAANKDTSFSSYEKYQMH